MSDSYLEYIDYPVTVQFLQLTEALALESSENEPDACVQPGAYASGPKPAVRILLMLSGRVHVTTELKTIDVHRGNGLIFIGNHPAEIRLAGKAPAEGCLMQFDPLFLFTQAGPLARRYLTPVIDGGLPLALNASEPQHSRALEQLWQAVSLHREKSFGYELAVKGSLCHFWCLLLQLIHTGGPALSATEDSAWLERLIPALGGGSGSRSPLQELDRGAASPGDRERIQNALHFLEAHYAEPVSLDMIAQAASLSRSECCRCFKRALGVTPFEYLQRYRIHMALCKLQNEDDDAETISGLSAAVGFNSSSYFNKTFKQLMHCTPMEYKKRLH